MKTAAASPRVIASLAMAVTGTLFFLALVFEDVADLFDTPLSEIPWALILRYAIAMAIGGAVSGLVLAGLFGRSGLIGWLLAILGGLAATVIAGVLGSFFGLSPELLANGWQSSHFVAIASGALVLPLAWGGWPILIPIWAAMVLLTHAMVCRCREEPHRR